MSTLDPETFLALEGALGYTLTQEWAEALHPVIGPLYDLLSQRNFTEARAVIDSFHMDAAVPNARSQIEELAVSAVIWGATQASGSTGTTAYLATQRPLPSVLQTAIDQLGISVSQTTAEEIRWALHLVVSEAEQQDKDRFYKEDLSVADLAENGGLSNPEQGGPDLKTLYVHRKLVNSAEVLQWAKEQGFTSMLDQADLHVTCCFSRDKVDWNSIGPTEDEIVITGGTRKIAVYGTAVVLTFTSPELQARHDEFMELGASHGFDEYKPHLTLTYAPGDLDLTAVTPYSGPLIFGAEVLAPLNEDWKSTITETTLQKAEVKSLADRLNDAVLYGKGLIDLNANLTTSRLIALGFLDQAVASNQTHYQVNEVLDERTCPICQMMHGKTFSVVTEYSKIMTVLGTTDPQELKALAPWPSQSKASVEKLAAMTPDELQKGGYGSPPYHPLCRGYLVQVGTVTEKAQMKLTPTQQNAFDDLVSVVMQPVQDATSLPAVLNPFVPPVKQTVADAKAWVIAQDTVTITGKAKEGGNYIKQPFKVKDDIDATIKKEVGSWDDVPRETFNPADYDIIATQDTLNIETLLDLLDTFDPDKAVLQAGTIYLTADGKAVVLDGHHRVLVAWLLGIPFKPHVYQGTKIFDL